ncbi:MAG: matrixin family metalloprotease [Paludibacteraceae bacterium]|nr:matrixin family metalloprotease [Paludibacteraceae bacterium]
MKIYKYLLMLPLALMAVSCSDENKEMIAEESSNSELKSIYLPRNSQELWEPGETIRYYFVGDGTEKQKQLVRECMYEYMNYANINFEEIPNGRHADVRIKFYNNRTTGLAQFKNCSSLIGKKNNKNLVWDESTGSMLIFPKTFNSEDDLRGMILHEIGHVLGLIDEVNNPNAKITFNQKSMITWFKQNRHASIADLDSYAKECYDDEFGVNFRNEYLKYSEYTAFDKNSIMMLDIPASWTGGTSYKHNNKLSVEDIKKLKVLYPFPNGIIPLFVGSNEVSHKYTFYTRSCLLHGFIGRWEDFNDKSLIRERIGYAYDVKKGGINNIPNASATDFCILITHEFEIYNGIMDSPVYGPDGTPYKTKNWSCKFAPGIIHPKSAYYDDIYLYTSGYGTFGNNVSSTDWWTYNHPLTDKNGYVCYAATYRREGNGRTPIIQYYNKKLQRYGVSYYNDEYMISKGYEMKPGIFYSVLNNAHQRNALKN